MLLARQRICVLLGMGLVLTASLCLAEFKIPLRPQSHVNDYAGVLTPAQKQDLQNYLRNYEQRTSNQIVVALFKSLRGSSIDDVSMRIAEQWKPGQRGEDNGVLITVFTKDRKARIEVGYGLEHKLTDALAKAVILNEMGPQFREGRYYLGLKQAVVSITKIISGDLPDAALRAYGRKVRAGKRNPLLSFLLLIILGYLFIRHPFLALLLLSSGFSSRGRYSGGFGGGFFGGGGSFGGGGASGDW